MGNTWRAVCASDLLLLHPLTELQRVSFIFPLWPQLWMRARNLMYYLILLFINSTASLTVQFGDGHNRMHRVSTVPALLPLQILI